MAEKPASKPVHGGPPVLPFKTFLNFIEWMGEVGVPQKIAREFWARKLAGSTGPLVIAALRFFDLIDENQHSKPQLDAIAQEPDQRKAFFKEQLNKRYGTVLQSVNLERATRGQLSEEFTKTFSVRGSVLVKAVIFFVHMARYAGVNVSNHIIIRERNESSKPRKKKAAAPSTLAGGQANQNTPQSLDTAPAQESLLLWGLFKRLPKPGDVWPKEERDHWVRTIENIFAMEYREKG